MNKEYKPIEKIDELKKTVAICAWCDETKNLTMEYKNNGYHTTHGICSKHLDEVLKELEDKYQYFF